MRDRRMLHFTHVSEGGSVKVKGAEGKEIWSATFGKSEVTFDLGALLASVPAVVEAIAPIVTAFGVVNKAKEEAFPQPEPTKVVEPVWIEPSDNEYNAAYDAFDAYLKGIEKGRKETKH